MASELMEIIKVKNWKITPEALRIGALAVVAFAVVIVGYITLLR